ncbi:DUF3122 domain-containing protein [Capilliphycus salinus ALCB114379]|uniref:DUF3122 domain-containing protein n=1 Tax=Capilliphycus salinus TaxID=2768948 RepID=UPI0039A63606
MREKRQRILSVFLILILFLTLNLSYSRPAQAEIRKQQETPEQVLYQSRHSLRDNTGDSWQVILFKRVKSGELAEINLRLVGFPGEVIFTHVQPLKIKDADRTLQADDVFAEKSPAPNVGQYDFKPILSQLSSNHLIELKLPLEKERTLKVPPAVILEWQSI